MGSAYGEGHLSMDQLWRAELSAYAAEEAACGKAAATLRLRLSYLRRLAATGAAVAASRSELVTWMASHEHWGPQSRASARAALISFYRWRVLSGRADSNPASDLPTIRLPARLPRPAPEEHVHTGSGQDGSSGLMVELAARAGLRRSEIATLRREDLDAAGLWIRGKGGRVRLVPVPPGLRARIEAHPAGWLFPNGRGGHLAAATVTARVRRASGSNPHALRHRYATRAYAGSRDLFAVQRLLGHANVATTQVYVDISPDALMAAVLAAA